MRISDAEVQRILQKQASLVADIDSIADGIDEPTYEIDPQFVKELARRVNEMPDREDFITELKARIDAGTYNPTADEIAEAMIRRTIADRVR
ncbi:MAG: flagellar biosynthesis anti-sigma factor FlgM [Armatimonadetes bacterium]|nr:flagellar biosynthesis anti-sigma factor FlgM [Armatimonadota bacterium]